MKKLLMGVAGTMMVLSLAACTPTKVEQVGKGETVETETVLSDGTTITTTKELPGGVTPEMLEKETVDPTAERPVDTNAELLETIMVYYPNEAGNGLTSEMVDVELMDEEVILEQLMDNGVLPYEVEINSFSVEGGMRPGPGVDPSETGSGERIGTLDLTQFPQADGTTEQLLLNAVANTFIENYELDKLKILVNGDLYTSANITMGEEDYLEYTNNYEK